MLCIHFLHRLGKLFELGLDQTTAKWFFGSYKIDKKHHCNLSRLLDDVDVAILRATAGREGPLSLFFWFWKTRHQHESREKCPNLFENHSWQSPVASHRHLLHNIQCFLFWLENNLLPCGLWTSSALGSPEPVTDGCSLKVPECQISVQNKAPSVAEKKGKCSLSP